MKLYTEEQIKIAIDEARSLDNWYEWAYNANEIIEKLTPIELPSDEEINEMGIDVIIYNDTKRGWFVEGLKFMRDKIQGGNK